MHPSETHTERTAARTERRPWTVLVIMAAAQFMVILDITVVNVALPSIGRELGFAADDLSWVVTTYVLFTGGLLILGGRMADLLGRRALFLAGLLTFTGASLASGLAPTPAALIASRGAQGLGAAMLSPAALSIVTTTYSGRQRTTALSTWGAIGAGGAAAGVLLGGVLTSWLSWEWIFFVNIPVGLAAAGLAVRVVPSARKTSGPVRELDLPGALTAIAGLAVLIYAIEGAATHGWGSARTLVHLAASVGLLAAFAAVERRASQPLVPATTWRIRSLVSSATVMLGATGLLVGSFFLNSLFMQNVLGASALGTGAAFLPLVVVIGVAAHVGPHLLARVGARTVVAAALVVVATGYALLTGASPGSSYATDLLPGFLLIGFGIGLTFVSISVTAMSEIDDERAGLASGLMTNAHELGGAFGVSIFSAIALGTGSAGGTALQSGYGDGAAAGALIAGLLALVAVSAVPSFRPAAADGVSMH